MGAVWEVDEGAGALRCIEVWRPDAIAHEFERVSRSSTFAAGIGLPGRVWSTGRPAWIPDVLDDSNFPRAGHAAQAELHGAIGFPIAVDGRVSGVIEFFSREVRPPDREALEMFQAVGVQIGQFVERRRAEAVSREREQELSDFLENASLGLHRVGLDGLILWANRTELEMLGYARDEYIGRPITDFHVDRAAIDDILARLGRGEELHDREARLRRKDGSILDVLISATVHADRRGVIHGRCFTRDVTVRRRAQDALRRERELLQALLDRIPVMITMYQPDTKVLRLNRQFERVVGWSSEEAAGVSLMEECYPDPALRAGVQEFMESCRPGWLDVPMRTRDGREIETSWANVRMSDDTRVGIGIDITERKLAEAERRTTEERFRGLAETVPSIIWTSDPDGVITYANERWYAYTGLTEEETATEWPERVLHPDDQERSLAEWRRALAAGTEFEIESRTRRHDGAYRWFLTRAVPIRDADDRLTAWFGVTTDVDDQKRAERERAGLLRAEQAARAEAESAQQRYQQLVDGLDAIVWEADVDRARFTFVSRRAEQILGYPVERGLQQKGFWVSLVHPEDRDRVLSQSRAATAECRDHDFEYRAATATGSELWLRDLVYVVRGEDGRAQRLRGIMVDVTEKNRAELALRDADRRKDEFLATLAHELRNPLAPLRNGLEILRLGGSDRDRAPVYQMMDRQVQHMVRLVDDLLELSRITRGLIELRRERLDVATVVRDAVETSRTLIETAGHQLTVSLPDEPLLIDGDPVRLAQVTANLLNNAAKYTDRGGHIWLTVERRGAEAAVSVRDDGIGISAEMLPHVFEMFTQVHRSRRLTEGGLGIGLSLVDTLVKMHLGRVTARSDGLGKGSEFTVHLPLAAGGARADADQHAIVRHAPESVRCRVLVVDDNHDAAESLGMLLTVMGCDVRIVYDGPTALDAVREHQPAIVLLDLGMPEMDGHEVSRRLRRDPGFRDVLLVALTGWGQEEDRRRSRAAGFDHHLVKPVSSEALQALIDAVRTRQTPERSGQTP
jgi:PAS domain S-box-containing protein